MSGISSALPILAICACPTDFIIQCFLVEIQVPPSNYQSIFRKKIELCCCRSLGAPKPGMPVKVVCWGCPTHPDSLLAGAAGGAELPAARPQPRTPRSPIQHKSLRSQRSYRLPCYWSSRISDIHSAKVPAVEKCKRS